MKLLNYIICLLGLFSIFDFSNAEIESNLPDLRGAIRGGELLARQNEEGFEGYRYKFNEEPKFESLKNDLGEFLGVKWVELERDPKEYLALKQVMKREGIFLEGVATFLNPEFPNLQIDLSMKKVTAEGKVHYIVLILGSPKNKHLWCQ